MRDARTQSRQIRGARRNRPLAGRRGGGDRIIDPAFVGEAFWRLAGAIVLESLAFIVWNIGTRPPLALLRDIGASFKDGRTFFTGLVCGLVGLIFISAATVLLLPVVPDPEVDFIPAQLFTLLIALVIEHLVGNDVRALATSRE